MKTSYLILASSIFLLFSCHKDKGVISLTYNKATAIYGSLDEIRTSPLVTVPKTIQNPGKIFIDENVLLIGEENEGIHVFDNTTPASPSPVSFIQIPFNKEFYIEDNIIYAETQYDLIKIDVSDLSNPTLIDRLENAFGTPLLNSQGEAIIGFSYAVATETFKINSPEEKAIRKDGYLYYDYLRKTIPPSSVPSSFTSSSRESKGTLNKIALSNDHVYVIGGTQLYTFHNTNNELSKIDELFLQNGIETIYPEDNKLFIGTLNSMLIVDITNPSNPVQEGTYFHTTSCDPVLPKENVAYLTLRTGDFGGCSGDENALHVIDIEQTSFPKLHEQITMTSPYGMQLINHYLFVGEGKNGLSIFDANDPLNLTKVMTKTNIEVYDIMEHPSNPNIILTTNESGLQQYVIDYNTLELSPLSAVNY
ncbi:MAG: hypothetical protein N4A35_04885 [Flavobacteriales bacterium]|jgi:hypothetical protein|nr:hypothetical protein [Flavobacteriales bacterium]